MLGLALQEQAYPISTHEASDGDLRVKKLLFDGKMPVNDVIGYATTSWRVEKQEDGVVKAGKCRYCTTIKKRVQNMSAINATINDLICIFNGLI